MTAQDVIDIIHKNFVPNWRDTGRDRFHFGDPNTPVTGIATTMMATFDVIKRMKPANLNLLITHENTFWRDNDDVSTLTDLPLYKIKTQYCKDNQIVIWRTHDNQHSRHPDQTEVGLLRTIGITDEEANMGGGNYTIPETTLGAFAAQIMKKNGWKACRVVGDPNAKISKVKAGPGYAYPALTEEIDVVVGGENAESDNAFDPTSYVRDAATAGVPKGQILLGHMVSEEEGMVELAKWLRPFIPAEIPIQFVRCGELWWT